MIFAKFRFWLAGLCTVVLVACGGGDAGTPLLGPDPSTTPPSASDLVLVLSASTVASSGTESVVATVTALDANRNAIASVPVTISANSDAIVTPSGTVTNASGLVTATVGIGANKAPRTITVTATSGALTRTAALQVRDAGSGGGEASDMVLQLSASSIANNGKETVTAIVTALDAKRNVLPGAVVTLSVDANGVIAPSGTTTDANGLLSGTVGIGGDSSNRTMTITAVSGSLARTAKLQVTNAVTAGTPTASDLSLVLSAARLDNGGTNTITATATAVDANRNALAGIPVTIRVDNSAVATVSGSTTNAAGAVVASIGIGSDRANRVVTVTAASGPLTRSASFSVDGARLTASLAPRVSVNSVGNQIEYTLVDTNSIAMVGQAIAVSAPGLPSAAGVTDNNGKFLYSYTAPAVAGTLQIVATSAGASRALQVEVGGGVVDPAPSKAESASITPSPSVVTVNQVGSNVNQVELRALFLGASNLPIPRMRVRFDLDGNANSTDGVISWLGGSYAYSDATGVARGAFTPGQRSSPTNGVTIRICYDTIDFDVSTCPNPTRSTLTVTQEALAISVRTNELIKEGAAKLTYIKEFVVMVVDAAGQAKADALITPSIDLPSYYKGSYFWNGKIWQQSISLAVTEAYSWNGTNWVNVGPAARPSCPNEDANRNGVREAPAYAAGAAAPALAARQEDLNWNGELDARKSDVAVKMVGSAKTDASGLAILQIEYGKDLATWVDFVITATASGVSGTEARAKYSSTLPAAAEAVTSETRPPAFVVSPYGTAVLCTDAN